MSKGIEGAVITLVGQRTTNAKKYVGKTNATGEIAIWYEYKTDKAPTDFTGLTSTQKPQPDKYKVNEVAYPEGYTAFKKKVAPGGKDFVFDYNNAVNNAVIEVTNSKIERTFVINNACGIEESTYQIVQTHDAKGVSLPTVKVWTEDLSKNSIGESIGGNDGVITISAGKNTVKIENLHLPAGTYVVKQLTASAGCELNDKPESKKIVEPNVDSEPPTTEEWPYNEEDPKIGTPVTNEDPDRKPIKDSEFKVYQVNDGTSCPTGSSAIDVTTGYTDVTSKVPGAELVNGKHVLKTNVSGQFEVDFSTLGNGKFVIVQDQVNKYYVNKGNVPVLVDGKICIENNNTPLQPPPPFINERGKENIEITKEDADDSKKFIEGAEITITGTLTPVNEYTATTDELGKATFENVLYDDYTITETKFPDGYEGFATTVPLNPDKRFVFNSDTVDTNKTIKLTNKKIKRNVTIEDSCTVGDRTYKIKDTTGAYVKDANGIEIVIILTEGQSIATLSNIVLNAGNYTAEQVSSTDIGCKTTEEPSFKVVPDEPTPDTEKKVTYKRHNVKITYKTCDVDGTTVAYDLYIKTGGTYTKTTKVVTPDANGQVTVTDLAAGEYALIPQGGDINSEFVKTFTIDVAQTGVQDVEVQTSKDCYKVQITYKTCDVDGTTVAYDLYIKTGGTYTKTTKVVTPGANGQVTVTDLAAGEYALIPQGGDINSEFVKTFTIDVAQTGVQDVEVQTSKDCYKVQITYKTCDVDGTTVAYDLYIKTGGTYTKTTKVVTPGANGQVTVTDLAAGEYALIPQGGDINSEFVKTFTIDVAQTGVQDVEVQTSKDCYKVQITYKTCDVDGTTVAYDLYIKTGGTYTKTTKVVTPGANGQVTVTDLAAGEYALIPQGGDINSEFVKTFTIDVAQTGVQDVEVQTSKDCYKVQITYKTCDVDGTTVAYDLYIKTGGTYTKTTKVVTPDANGQVTVTDLAAGEYALIPQGGDINSEFVKTFTIDVAQTGVQDVEVQTSKDCYKVQITYKTCDVDGTTVAYDLYIKTGGTYTKTTKVVTPDANGQVTVTDLAAGEYALIPQGGDINSEFVKTFTIDVAQTGVQDVEVQTSKDCYKVQITYKTCDVDGTTVAYDLYIKTGGTYTKTTKVVTPGANGQVTVTDLAAGEYALIPQGGDSNSEFVKTFTIDVAQTGVQDVEVQTSKDCYKVQITYKTCDVDGTTVAYDLYIKTGGTYTKTTKVVTPDANGQVTVTDLAAGEYALIPQGGDSNSEFVKTFTIDVAQTGVQDVEVQTSKNCSVTPAYNVNITLKACAQNNPKTTTLDIYKDGVKVDTVNLDGSGQGSIKVSNLREGVYVAIPTGQTPKVDSATFTIPATPLVADITVTVIEECPTTPPGCTAVTITFLQHAGKSVTISDGTDTKPAQFEADGKLIIPFKEGTITVTDSDGKELGSVVVKDCVGTFTPKGPACESVYITLLQHAGKSVTISDGTDTKPAQFEADGKLMIPFKEGYDYSNR